MNAQDDASAAAPVAVSLPFNRHHAIIIGIDAYEHVATLKTARNDALRLAEVLSESHQFEVHPPLLDASGEQLRRLLHETLPRLVGPNDRVLLYFAGHGIAVDGDDEGPAGYLVPTDADRSDIKTFLPMADVQSALQALPCRHLLLILDCCFSGAFKWSGQTRSLGSLMPKIIYKERFDRFVLDPAWQVLTSAAHDQKAMDVLHDRAVGCRSAIDSGDDRAHSPFAEALFDGLAGKADAAVERELEGDGVITATELYTYIRNRVEPRTIEAGQSLRQTPGFFPLGKHDKGEFVFLHPRHRSNLQRTPKRSPYMGLAGFNDTAEDRVLFYGRDRVIEELAARCDRHRLLVVSGASGTGKSSVVKAGLLPALRAAGHCILPVMRPGEHPLAALEVALKQASRSDSPQRPVRSILVIDQYEETVTRCTDRKEREQFETRLKQLLDGEHSIGRIVLTVRADFEPLLGGGALKDDWLAGRYTVPTFSLEELKKVVVLPTIQQVLFFEPPELVDKIVEEVAQSTGALPLLSYTLSELYEAYVTGGRSDRALTEADYNKLGGVRGALRTKADALYNALAVPEQQTMRKIMLRMVSVEGDFAARRVPLQDLVYSEQEAPLVSKVIEALVDARLVAKGDGYVEPAHDALVRAWGTVRQWVDEAGKDKLILGTKLNEAADDFARSNDVDYLWNNSPDLAGVAQALKEPTQWFNAREVTFIQQSLARKKRRLRNFIAGAVTVGVFLSVATLVAWVQRGTALESSAKAQLATEDAKAATENERVAKNAALAATKLQEAATAKAEAAANSEQLAKNGAEQARDKEAAARLQAQASERKARDEALASNVARIVAESQGMLAGTRAGGDERAMLGLLAVHRLAPDSVPTHAAVYDLVVKSSKLLKIIDRASAEGNATFSPDGKLVVSGDTNGMLWVWDSTTAKLVGMPWTAHHSPISGIAFNFDGTRIASSSLDDTIQLSDAKTRRPVGQAWVAHQNGVSSIDFSPDGKQIITGGVDHTLRLWDASSGQPVGAPWTGHQDEVTSVSFSPDGTQVGSGGMDMMLRLWDARTGQPIGGPRTGHRAGASKIAFSPDGRQIISASWDKTLRLWDTETAKQLGQMQDQGWVLSVDFSPDGTQILSSGVNTLQLWNPKTRQPIGAPWQAHHGMVYRATFEPNGTRILSTGEDHTVRLWDPKAGQPIPPPIGFPMKVVRSVAYSPDGARIVVGSTDQTLRVHDAKTGQQMGAAIAAHSGIVTGVAFSADGTRIVTGGDDATLRLWNAKTMQPIGEPWVGQQPVTGVAFSPDGRHVVSGSTDATLQLWNATSGQPIGRPWVGHQQQIQGLAISPDGSRVVSGSADHTLRLWDAKTGQPIGKAWTGHQGSVTSVAFSPDGRHVASGSFDKMLRLWSVATGQAVGAPWAGHHAPVFSIAFSPDGKHVVSGGDDDFLQLWDARSGQPFGVPLPVSPLGVGSVAFSPDGTRIVSGARNGALHLWPGPKTADMLLCSKLTRNLSHAQWAEWISPNVAYQRPCPDLPEPTDRHAVASKG